VQRQFRLGEEELQGLQGCERAGCVGACRREDLGNLVGRLNRGEIPDPGDFYVVHLRDTEDYVSLYKPGRREAAVEALGLNESNWQAQPPRVVSIDSEPLLGTAEASAAQAPAVTSPAPAPVPPAPLAPAVAAGGAPAPAAVPVDPELQETFYQVLFAAVLPLFEQTETITGQQALQLLRRSEPRLPEEMLQRILEAEVDGRDRESGQVDRQTLQRMGQLVAHAQAGHADITALRGSPPNQVPRFRGLLWDQLRPKKLSVLEPF